MKSLISFGQPKKLKSKWPIAVRRIHGHSMMPVLPPGTYIWVTGWFSKLKIGDIVMFLHDNKEKIKRIDDIKDSEIFVVGDHAEASTDSRQFGWIKEDTVIAKLFWPHAPKSRAENVEAAVDQTSPDK